MSSRSLLNYNLRASKFFGHVRPISLILYFKFLFRRFSLELIVFPLLFLKFYAPKYGFSLCIYFDIYNHSLKGERYKTI